MVGFASGQTAIAICDRCKLTLPYQALRRDGDNPGLRVCRDCNDRRDPYKLPARQLEPICMRYPRPDTDIATETSDYDEVAT